MGLRERTAIVVLVVLVGASFGCGAQPTTPTVASSTSEPSTKADPATTEDTFVHMDRFRSMRFGSSVADAEAALADRIVVPSEGCHLVAPSTAGQPPRFTLLVHDGIVARMNVTSADLAAEGGGRIGMHADELRRAYAGNIVEEPHKYDPAAATWIVGPPGAAHFVFELDGSRRVKTWRAGVPPQIDWVENCG
jgi:hypothetical protein